MTHVISFLVGVVLALYMVGDFNISVAYKKQSVVSTGASYDSSDYGGGHYYNYSHYQLE